MGLRLKQISLVVFSAFFSFGLAAVLPINPYLKIAISLLFLMLVVMKEKIYSVLFMTPILFISFLPSSYVSVFRIPSALGELRPTFLIVPLLIAFTIFFRKLNLDWAFLKENRTILNFLFLFLVSNVITAVIQGNYMSNIRYSIFTFILGYGIFLMVSLSSGLINPYKAIKYSVLVSTAVCIIGLIEFFGIQPYASYYLMDNPWFNYDNRVMDGLPRIASSIGNPLVLSGYLLMFLPFTLYVKENEKKKLFWNIAFVIHLVALLLTVSRSAYLVAAVVVLYYLYKTMNPIKVTGFMVILAVAAISAYFVLDKFNLMDMFMNRILFKTEAESFSIRAYAFIIIRDILKESFFFGIGTDIKEFLLAHGTVQISTLDNVFLTVISGSGVIGFVIFMIPLIFLFNKFRKFNGMDKFAGYSILMAFVGMGFSYNILYFEATWGVFWILSGLLLLKNYHESKGDN